MRTLLCLLCAALLAGCAAGNQPRRPSPLPAPTTPAVGELLARPTAGAARAVGYLLIGSDGARLVDRPPRSPSAEPDLAQAIWVEAPPDSPAGDASDAPTLVEARGTLEGPGAFGPGGRYVFRMVAPELRPLSVRELTLPLLQENSALYEGQPVRLKGQLITGPEGAILVERLGPGGVPAASALQIKLLAPPRDPGLIAALRPAANSAIRFGPVEVTGLWRAGGLYPLLVTPDPASLP